MSSKTCKIPVKTWQFFNACKKNLGLAVLVKLFKVSPRQIDRWACDPDFADSSQRNPLDRHETLLKKLVDLGVEDIAIASVDRQAKIVGCVLRVESSTPDKETILEELLDDLPVLADFQEAIKNKEPIEIVREKGRLVIQEIEEDIKLYWQELK